KSMLGPSLVVLAVLGASACAKREIAVVDCADFVVSPSQFAVEFVGPAGTVTQQEHTFICRATMFARGQVIFGRMAPQRTQSPAVLQSAQATANDAADLNHRLARIAIQQDGVPPPRGLDLPHFAIRDRLAGLSGYAFDRAYLQQAIAEE